MSFGSAGESAADYPDLQALCKNIQLVPRNKSYTTSDLIRGVLLKAPFHVYNYQVHAMSDAVQNITSQQSYDLIQIEDVVMAQYLNGNMTNAKCILDMHNVESSLLRRYAEKENSFFKRIYAGLTALKLERYEQNVSSEFHQVHVCSEEDQKILKESGINTPVHVVPNGVDCNYFQVQPLDPNSRSLVFVGSMDYHANISGVHYFVRDILPLIHQKCLDAHFYIVGKNPPESIRKLENEKITVTGMVFDVREYLALARVVVVPLLVGGGTRLKILEAMACGRPVVATSLGAEGIDAVDKEQIYIADDPSQFAKYVLRLLEDIDLCNNIASSSNKLVNDIYSWNAIQDEMISNIGIQF